MIGFITGRVDHIGTNFCLVDTQGVGYRIFLNTGDLSRIQVDQKVKIYTYLSVREDALQLFGFLSYDAYSLFTQLITVSGIGPKVAQGILSAAKVDAFYLAVKNRDLKFLTKLPGIGKKSAERLILELKDKVAFRGREEEELLTIENGEEVGDDAASEAMAALQSLGYTPSEIAPVIRKTAKYKTTEAIIKASLKELSHM